MLIRRFAFAACLGALLLVSPAQAAPGWLAPQGLSAPGQDASGPQIALDAAGNALAVWIRQQATLTGSYARAQAAFRPSGGGWQAVEDLSAPDRAAFSPQVDFDAAGNAVAVWLRYSGADYVAQGAMRPAGGSWQAGQDLSVGGQSAFNAALAVGAAGDALAVWTRSNGTNQIAQASFRPAGGAWQPPEDLSAVNQSASNPRVAVDPAGNAVAVWYRFNGTHYIVQAAFRPAGGSWQLPAIDLSAAGQSAFQPQVAFDPAGNAIAVWRRDAAQGAVVQAAFRPAGGAWQLPALDLSATGGSSGSPQIALDPGGNALAVWQRGSGVNSIVQASFRPAGGAWEAAKDLSALGQSSRPQVAFDSAGNAIAVWQRVNGPVYGIQSALRPAASGSWQAGEDRSAAGQNALDPQVAFDRAGNATAIWEGNVATDSIIQVAPYDATAPLLRNVDVPTTGFARQSLAFSVDPFDTWSPLGPPTWNFGDGKSASGTMVRHTYAKGGAYTVTVTQADAVANETAVGRQLLVRTARCFGSPATRVGTSGPDRIRGTRRADVIVSLGGADRIRGRGGKDRICGGKGRDRLAGGAGNDRLNGGPGRDICSQGKGRGRLVSC